MSFTFNLHRYGSGTQSTKFCLVLASNRPEDLDDAVLDRMDELVEFPLPAAAERARILRQHVDGALNGGGGGGGGGEGKYTYTNGLDTSGGQKQAGWSPPVFSHPPDVRLNRGMIVHYTVRHWS